jgi:Gpi18-like mannosyltransferase
MVRRSRPLLAAAALAAWLWSPLLLIATAIGALNDAAMLVLLLLMLWLLQRRRWFLALLALILAAHVKLTALIVAPVVGLWLVRRCGWRRTLGLSAAAAAAGLLFSWLLYAPFGGWGSLPRMLTERAAYLANSPWRILYLFLSMQRGWPIELVRRLTVQLPTALFAAGAVLMSLWMFDFRPRRWQAAPAPDWRDDRLLWRTAALVVLLYLVVGSFWFQHWYLVWVLAPAALLPDALLTRWLLPWLGFGALSANVISAFAPALASEPLSKIALAALIVAAIWTPMLIASGWHLGRLRTRKHQGGE